MEPFEPPKYIASLIAAINDGAKTAQTGALAFSLVGLYLVSTALATTDEDLLLQHTTTISQLGVQIPVVVSFAIAPMVFVALHVFTLIRYDMLSTNLGHFCKSLESQVPLKADQENCRQLLANVEFVLTRVAPRGSPLQNWIFRWVVFGVIVIFPVAVLTAVQISSLRDQSEGANWVQRIATALDLFLLVWFFRRQKLAGRKERDFGFEHRLRMWIGLVWIPVVLIAANIAWMNIPGPEATTVRAGLRPEQVLTQPLDLVLCPIYGFGCRYLTFDNRTSVGHVWNSAAIADFRLGSRAPESVRAAVEGVVLINRALRFANLRESRLYAADLRGADLRGAELRSAKLSAADLGEADLRKAALAGADLRGAELSEAHLSNADLRDADLRDADLSSANLTRAELNNADLGAADLFNADLRGASLLGAHLSGVRLEGADLRGACLYRADLGRAQLREAHLGGADFSYANLSDADLSDADLTQAGICQPPVYPKASQTLSQSQLDAACGTGAKVPAGLTWHDRDCEPRSAPIPGQ